MIYSAIDIIHILRCEIEIYARSHANMLLSLEWAPTKQLINSSQDRARAKDIFNALDIVAYRKYFYM